ncbi:MAG TPA: hypothetical protein VHM90_19145, partial [Phycisphaerae bacterium]|nr:hypothetical protein [Phycisphaerae bacterium]
ASNVATKPPGTDSVTNPSGTTSAAVLIGVLNLLLLAGSVLSGLIALCFVPKLGRKGILGRSVVGVLISSVFLAGAAYLFLMPSFASGVQKRITGNWYSTLSAPGMAKVHVKMALNTDGSASWELLDGPRPVVITGRWSVFSPSRTSVDMTLQIRFNAANPNFPGKDGLGWHIASSSETQLELSTNDAAGNPSREVYIRTAPKLPVN